MIDIIGNNREENSKDYIHGILSVMPLLRPRTWEQEPIYLSPKTVSFHHPGQASLLAKVY